MTFGTVAAVVSTVAGVNSLMGGSSGGQSSGTYDPYGKYRGQAATQLNTLLAHPEQAMSQPGYQQTLKQGIEASKVGAAATGNVASGGELEALQSVGQNTFGSYYNSMLANLMQLSGASQAPAAANQAMQQGANLSQARQIGGLQTLTSGLGSLGQSGLFSSSGGVGGISSGGYGTPVNSGTGADYGSWMSDQGIAPIQNF